MLPGADLINGDLISTATSPGAAPLSSESGAAARLGKTSPVPTLHLDDLDLYYELRGSGPRLLMCNGSGATIEGTGILIDRLAAHFEVLVHDQRCLGRTSIPEVQPTMADYASDAIALLDHVGWPTTRVFGISFGGMVALELAVTVPERIDRLALLCTSAGGAGGSSYPLHDLLDLPADERLAISKLNMDTRFTDEWLADHAFERMLIDGMVERSTVVKSETQLRGEAMQLEARAHHDVWDRLPLITCPTLVACGRYDGQAKPENSAAIHSRIVGSELRTYEGGHLFVFQDRTALAEIVTFMA